MAFDWLFGPTSYGDPASSGSRFIRALVVEREVIADLIRMFRDRSPERITLRLDAHHPNGTSGESFDVPDDDAGVRQLLAGLSNQQLQGLHVISLGSGATGTSMYLDLSAGRPTMVNVAIGGVYSSDDFADVLTRAGRPRARIRALARFVPALFAGGILVSWVWFVVTEHPVLSLAVAGSGLVLAASVASILVARWIEARMRSTSPGMRIIALSRAELRLDRANRHRDFWVAVITAVVTAAVTYATTALVQSLSGP